MNVFNETPACCFVFQAARAVGMMPIHQRIVESKTQAFRARGLDVFADQIASRSLLGRAIIGELGVEVTETFVMLRGHHHVLHAGAPGQLGPRARGIWNWFELRRQLFILGHGNAFVLHHPLVTAKRAVESPVNEHAELRFVPPLHPSLAIFDGGGRGRPGIGRFGLLAKHQISLTCSRQRAGRSTHQRQVVSSVHFISS